MTPVLRQSGRTKFLRRPNGGNKSLKRVFYQSAFCSLAQDDSRTFYERNRRERKRHHQAVIALARRRINVLWAVVQSRTPFPNQIQIGHVTEPLGCLWLLPDDCASGVVVGQSMRSPEHRQLAIRIFAHPHLCLHEMRSQSSGRQLQAQPVPLHRIVVTHRSIRLDAQDLVPYTGRIGDERRTFLLGVDREPLVVFCNVDHTQPPVGGIDRADPASANSFGSQSCSVANIRSDRPRACGE